MNPISEWFWLLLTIAVVIWYSSVTIYVAIRGAMDIKSMLLHLGKAKADAEPPSAET